MEFCVSKMFEKFQGHASIKQVLQSLKEQHRYLWHHTLATSNTKQGLHLF